MNSFGLLLTVSSLTVGVLLTGCHHSASHVLTTEIASQYQSADTAPRPKTFPSGKGMVRSTNTISQSVTVSHKISKQDYVYVYDGLKDKRFSVQDALAALSSLIAAKNLTQSQKLQVGSLCVALLHTPYPNDSSSELKPIIITLIGVVGDKRAIPRLVPLLKDPDDTIRLAAQGSLKDLGYKVPPIQSLLY